MKCHQLLEQSLPISLTVSHSLLTKVLQYHNRPRNERMGYLLNCLSLSCVLVKFMPQAFEFLKKKKRFWVFRVKEATHLTLKGASKKASIIIQKPNQAATNKVLANL